MMMMMMMMVKITVELKASILVVVDSVKRVIFIRFSTCCCVFVGKVANK